jgi:heme-degrading monooxygenase HmoA
MNATFAGELIAMGSTAAGLVLINAFEVAADADEPFVAGWEGAREFLAARRGFSATALHRAILEDADFRFVSVARVQSPEVWREAINDPVFPGGKMPFKARPGLYEVVYEDGQSDGTDGVLLINLFEVPSESDDGFLAGWHETRAFLAGRPGYLGTRLHRSVGPADFRFVNIARWSSPLAFARAVGQPEFQQTAAALPFPSHPALYGVIRG